ncbi:ribosome maturation factor RimM [Pedobacter chitinilyticus]|jgi:16S rRNA processing protein RimM|uniref:Ribosome maturation factor RimM n=1 Tax=Pedobacter chitinilyticus TaxID=2233776 RepID=A0A3S3SQ78_9SPHI|nr:ribosome maturation factor RimM [Pedobacter chitinilyticus]RWU05448.1 16S rRNA processing protein RimM [Pedobacter chitinilyticus]
MTKEESFYIGYITKTKGLKGELQLYFEFEDYQDLDLDVIFLELNGKMVPFFVASHKLYENSTGLFYFDDVDHVDKAQPLVKKKAYLPLSKKPEREDDEFYYTDLKGFIAVDETLGELGEIIEVNEYPQQFVATVNYQNKEILFPLNEDFIVEIDDEENILTLDLPEGLLDIYLNP